MLSHNYKKGTINTFLFRFNTVALDWRRLHCSTWCSQPLWELTSLKSAVFLKIISLWIISRTVMHSLTELPALMCCGGSRSGRLEDWPRTQRDLFFSFLFFFSVHFFDNIMSSHKVTRWDLHKLHFYMLYFSRSPVVVVTQRMFHVREISRCTGVKNNDEKKLNQTI